MIKCNHAAIDIFLGGLTTESLFKEQIVLVTLKF